MKPAAIATTLLLHAAAVGTIVHLQPEHGTTQSKIQPFEISLVSGRKMASAKARTTAIPVVEPTASEQFVAADHQLQPQKISDATDTHAAPSGSSSFPASTVKTGVSIPASYANSNRKPEYPLLSRKQDEQGTVLLRILVKADGTADRIQVRQTSGYPLLDESAVSAVQQWRFNPASIDNMPIAEWYQVAIPFTLHN